MSSTSLRGGTTKQSPVITERPILFQTEMVKAILDLRKTQTRRTKGLEARNENPDLWTREDARTTKMYQSFEDFDKKVNWCPFFEFRKTAGQAENESHYTRPRYNIGDLLWVRESWNTYSEFVSKPDYSVMGISDFVYRADDNRIDKWKPSIHMPKAAARIWLMIEDIRVERVQEISERDAMDEGVEFWNNPLFNEVRFKDYQNPNSEWRNANTSFASLWISINGEESWKANPWVWVIQFRVLSTTGRPSDEVIQANYKEVRNG